VALNPTGATPTAEEMATRLRRMDPPVVARIERDALLVDLRTVDQGSDRVVADSLVAAARAR
jgi:hypothetical protein